MYTIACTFNRIWRIIGTGFVFLVFGIAASIFSALVLPFLRVVMSVEKRGYFVRRVVRRSFLLVLSTLKCMRIGAVDISEKEAQRLQKISGALVVANHPSFLDVVALLAYIPDAACVAKVQLKSNFFIKNIVHEAGYIAKSDTAELLEECNKVLRAGRTLILFPEGTRSPEGGLRPFQRGAATIAIRTGCDILPIIITCEPPALLKGAKWYEVPPVQFRLHIKPCDPLEISVVIKDPSSFSKGARELTSYLQELYSEQLGFERRCRKDGKLQSVGT